MQAYNTTMGDRVVQTFSANGTPGELVSVRTSMGRRVQAWRPTTVPSNPQTCYFCHGYSLKTYAQFGYSVMSGIDLTTVLADEFMKVGTLDVGPVPAIMAGDIIVWWQHMDAVHSAVVQTVVVTAGKLDQNATLVSSKTGTGIVRIHVPLATVNADYKTATLREVYRNW